jgi:hypothetical protein
MEELDRKDWEIFQANTSDTLSVEEVKTVAQLHSKYFKHNYHVPCSCNPKRILKWINDINEIYNQTNE